MFLSMHSASGNCFVVDLLSGVERGPLPEGHQGKTAPLFPLGWVVPDPTGGWWAVRASLVARQPSAPDEWLGIGSGGSLPTWDRLKVADWYPAKSAAMILGIRFWGGSEVARGDVVIGGIAFTPADQETLRLIRAEPYSARCARLAQLLCLSKNGAKKRLEHLRLQTSTSTVNKLLEWVWRNGEAIDQALAESTSSAPTFPPRRREADSFDRSDVLRIGVGSLIGPIAAQRAAASARDAAVDRSCAQSLAWEMWQRQTYSLHASELPEPVAHHLGAMATDSASTVLLDGVVLGDREGCYSFAHRSFIDFFIAQRIFGAIRAGESNLFATAQTTHETDLVIREFVLRHDGAVDLLVGWMKTGSSAVLRVNSAGVLAKLGATQLSDDVINVLKGDVDTRQMYLTAVASRVLSIPWDQASRLVASVEGHPTGLSSHLPSDSAAHLATRFASEARNPRDSGARWCSVVLLSQVEQAAPETVLAALQQALSEESCRENLRAIGRALAGSNPIST